MLASHGANNIILVTISDADEASIRSILEAADRVQRIFGVRVRVDVSASLELDPLGGWIHRIGEPTVLEGPYTITSDGARVSVVFSGKPQGTDIIENALVEAAMRALAGSVDLVNREGEETPARRDPDTFAAGEYTLATAAM